VESVFSSLIYIQEGDSEEEEIAIVSTISSESMFFKFARESTAIFIVFYKIENIHFGKTKQIPPNGLSTYKKKIRKMVMIFISPM